MTTTEKSVEEILKEFWTGVMEVNVEDIKSDTIYLVSDDDIKNLLQAERQKREEMVRVERKNSHYTGYSKALLEVEQWHINDKSLTGKVKNMLKALNQPNNPNV